MRHLLRATLAAGLLAAPLAALADEEDDIKYRSAVMKAISGHTGAIAQIAKGKVAHDEALVGHAHALAELSDLVAAAFENKALGDSRAKPEIWSDWEGFEARIDDFQSAAADVRDAAETGPDATAAKLKPLFDSCKGCHEDYRKEKE